MEVKLFFKRNKTISCVFLGDKKKAEGKLDFASFYLNAFLVFSTS